jgi:hypothetical protein
MDLKAMTKIKPPALEYCWIFLHTNPNVGWCGGTADSEWIDDKSVVETNASFCQYETKILTREKSQRKKPVPPGSVRPSTRNQAT